METVVGIPLELLCVIVSSCSTIICGLIAVRSEKSARSIQEQRELDMKQEERRIRESMLSLKLMNANCELTVGTALAVKRGYANGELESGIKAVKEAQKEYEDFLHSIAVEDMVHKR